MTKRLLWFLTFLSLIFCISLIIIGIKTSSKNNTYDEQLKRIEIKLDSLYAKKDSVRTIILTVDRKIIENQKSHEKVVNSIIIQPSALDSVFARDYIQRFINERVR